MLNEIFRNWEANRTGFVRFLYTGSQIGNDPFPRASVRNNELLLAYPYSRTWTVARYEGCCPFGYGELQ